MAMFITFEGGDGSGKSTQTKILYEYLKKQGYEIILTHEPGGTSFGNMCRAILLEQPKDKKYKVGNRAQVLGFCASRAQLIEEVIMPNKNNDQVIIVCDRFADSTIAYQVYGGDLDEKLDDAEKIIEFATHGIKPDLTIYLDIPIDEGLKRIQGRLKTDDTLHQFGPERQLSFLDSNIFDEQKLQFHKKVREGYEWSIKHDKPERWFRVDANRPLEVIAEEIRGRVMIILAEHKIFPKNKTSK